MKENYISHYSIMWFISNVSILTMYNYDILCEENIQEIHEKDILEYSYI